MLLHIKEKGITVNEFSIYHIFRLFVKNFFILLLTAILFGVANFCYCEFKLQERYSASGSILVNNGGVTGGTQNNNQYANNGTVNNGDITASINLIKTVENLLSRDDDLYESLSKKLDGKYQPEQLKRYASIAKADDYSMIINVNFELPNQNDAQKITNIFLELTPDVIKANFDGADAKIVERSKGASKTYPRTFFSTAIAMVIGAVLAFIIVYIISLFNTTIKSEEEFKERYNIPVLGDIPDFATAKSGKYAKSYYKGGNYYGN